MRCLGYSKQASIILKKNSKEMNGHLPSTRVSKTSAEIINSGCLVSEIFTILNRIIHNIILSLSAKCQAGVRLLVWIVIIASAFGIYLVSSVLVRSKIISPYSKVSPQ